MLSFISDLCYYRYLRFGSYGIVFNPILLYGVYYYFSIYYYVIFRIYIISRNSGVTQTISTLEPKHQSTPHTPNPASDNPRLWPPQGSNHQEELSISNMFNKERTVEIFVRWHSFFFQVFSSFSSQLSSSACLQPVATYWNDKCFKYFLYEK